MELNVSPLECGPACGNGCEWTDEADVTVSDSRDQAAESIAASSSWLTVLGRPAAML